MASPHEVAIGATGQDLPPFTFTGGEDRIVITLPIGTAPAVVEFRASSDWSITTQQGFAATAPQLAARQAVKKILTKSTTFFVQGTAGDVVQIENVIDGSALAALLKDMQQ